MYGSHAVMAVSGRDGMRVFPQRKTVAKLPSKPNLNKAATRGSQSEPKLKQVTGYMLSNGVHSTMCNDRSVQLQCRSVFVSMELAGKLKSEQRVSLNEPAVESRDVVTVLRILVQ